MEIREYLVPRGADEKGELEAKKGKLFSKAASTIVLVNLVIELLASLHYCLLAITGRLPSTALYTPGLTSTQ